MALGPGKIAQAQAVLEQLEVSLDETEIQAPFDGVITAKYVEEGSMISQGTPLVAIQDPLDNWVDFKVPETHRVEHSHAPVQAGSEADKRISEKLAELRRMAV